MFSCTYASIFYVFHFMNDVFSCKIKANFYNPVPVSKIICHTEPPERNYFRTSSWKNPFWSLAATSGSVMLLKRGGGGGAEDRYYILTSYIFRIRYSEELKYSIVTSLISYHDKKFHRGVGHFSDAPGFRLSFVQTRVRLLCC